MPAPSPRQSSGCAVPSLIPSAFPKQKEKRGGRSLLLPRPGRERARGFFFFQPSQVKSKFPARHLQQEPARRPRRGMGQPRLGNIWRTPGEGTEGGKKRLTESSDGTEEDGQGGRRARVRPGIYNPAWATPGRGGTAGPGPARTRLEKEKRRRKEIPGAAPTPPAPGAARRGWFGLKGTKFAPGADQGPPGPGETPGTGDVPPGRRCRYREPPAVALAASPGMPGAQRGSAVGVVSSRGCAEGFFYWVFFSVLQSPGSDFFFVS